MSFLLAATSAVLLQPVALDDPLLQAEETFVSEAAQAAIGAGSVDRLHCLDLPQHHPNGARVCLTRNEWLEVFGRVSQEESVEARQRAMQIADYYSRF
ncbi:hypothetical protein [Aurantiacibacter poecillastricola]|uniref:hypothetical protein n=1 Tax=Aurantiacibacter poecillastricola TaxID=3064385 RepID=UPI00273FBB4E|nr:hypothetical protein [Aurantiacibacter sp. 219JJ12-13]MDP5261933.1 hypothetical protein [Aurantiacibacter sp. 219JJ12-13]